MKSCENLLVHDRLLLHIPRADLDIDVTVSRDMYYPNKVFQ